MEWEVTVSMVVVHGLQGLVCWFDSRLILGNVCMIKAQHSRFGVWYSLQ